MSDRPDRPVTAIAFDADDTLWHNERFFQDSQARFGELLADFATPHAVDAALLATEKRNIALYGFRGEGLHPFHVGNSPRDRRRPPSRFCD